MATIQQAINQARQQGISEDLIKKKVESIGGSYTPPTSMSNVNIGITGPEELLSKSNLPKPSFLQKVGNFLAPTTTANVRDVFAAGKVGGYVTKQDEITRQLTEIVKQIQQAKSVGDTERVKQLVSQSRAISGGGEAVEAPQFSQYTQGQIGAGKTGDWTDYIGRGIKSGAEIGSYLTPIGKGLGVGAKAGLGALGGGLRGFGSSEMGGEVGGAASGAAIGGSLSLAGQGLSWLGKQITPKIIKASGASENAIIRKFGMKVQDLASKYGKSADELLGPIEQKNRGGAFAKGLNDAEKVIQDTVTTSGTNIRIDGKTVIGALKKELNLQKSGLDDDVVKGLTEIIKTAEKKYKNGITAKQALKVLRQANSKFGKAMATTPQGSTTKIAQLTIAESMRESLKKMFPEIADSLQTQSEILTLRPIIEKARSSAIAGAGKGISIGKFDITRPFTYPLVGPAGEALINKGIPAVMKGAGAVLQSPLTRQAILGGLNVPQETQETQIEEPPQITPTITPQMQPTMTTGGLPTPQGQPVVQPTPSDITAETTQQKSLTGYTPEQLYAGAMKAYQAGDKDSYTQLRNMYDDETAYQKEAGATKLTKQKISETNEVIDNIDTVLGRNLTWMTGLASPLGMIPGTAGYDTKRMVQQIKDQLSLASVGKLKGQGQVSDAERKMLANASTALDVNMTQEAFRNELNKVKGILQRSLK